jgi:hypothetical protein
VRRKVFRLLMRVVCAAAAHRGVEIGQVAFEQGAVDLGESGHLCRNEGGEASDHADSRAYGAGVDAAGQPPAGPALGQIPQPGLGDLLEGDGGRVRVDEAEIAQSPDGAGVFPVPATAVDQFLDAPAGAE